MINNIFIMSSFNKFNDQINKNKIINLNKKIKKKSVLIKLKF